jgi:hypothetical protein
MPDGRQIGEPVKEREGISQKDGKGYAEVIPPQVFVPAWGAAGKVWDTVIQEIVDVEERDIHVHVDGGVSWCTMAKGTADVVLESVVVPGDRYMVFPCELILCSE